MAGCVWRYCRASMSYAWILPPICDPKVKIPNIKINIDRLGLLARTEVFLKYFACF
jgi:hypothetical protein